MKCGYKIIIYMKKSKSEISMRFQNVFYFTIQAIVDNMEKIFFLKILK